MQNEQAVRSTKMSVFTIHLSISSHNNQFIAPKCLYLLSTTTYHHTTGRTLSHNVCIYYSPQHINTKVSTFPTMSVFTIHHSISSHNRQYIPPQGLYLLSTSAYHHIRLHSSSMLLSQPDNSYFL